MATSCDANSLIAGAKCIAETIPAELQLAVQTYLLAVLAGASTDPNVLLSLAASFQKLPAASCAQIQAYLLCQIVNK